MFPERSRPFFPRTASRFECPAEPQSLPTITALLLRISSTLPKIRACASDAAQAECFAAQQVANGERNHRIDIGLTCHLVADMRHNNHV